MAFAGLFLLNGCDKAPEKKPLPEVELKDISVYVDTSVSMRGYFRNRPQDGTLFQRFIWNGLSLSLREVLTNEKIYLTTFGSEIDKPLDLGPSETFLKKFRFESKEDIKSFFSDKDTKLVELFDNKALTEDRLFVIMTDGLPSAPDGSGPDPRIKTVIRKKVLDQGFHLWLIGLCSEFQGIVYSESPGKTGSKVSFYYHGVRPVYIWVGTKKMQEGNAVVHEFYDRLRQMIDEEADERLAVELIEFPCIELPRAKLNLSKDDIHGEPISKVKIFPKKNYLEVWTSKKFIGDVDIPLVIEWEGEEINHNLKLSFNHEAVWQMNAKGTWALNLKSDRIPRRMNIIMKAAPQINKWWETWSTDDDSRIKNADKTLYLRRLVEDLYVHNEIEAGELHLRFR
jgi:hypothetical protein